LPDSGSVDFPWATHRSLKNLGGNVVLVRVDFNVPLSDEGEVTDSRRMRAALPTLRELLDRDLKPVLMAHLGRPGGQRIDELSLRPLVSHLEDFLDCSVRFAEDCVGTPAEEMVENLKVGEVGLLENLRFHADEKADDDDFAQELAGLGDAYVNEAFGAAHRAHASISGVPRHRDPAVAGNLMENEYTVLTGLREKPERPLAVLLGGAKVGDKFPLIRTLLDTADTLLIGGAMAHTFFRAKGHELGESLVDEESVDEARELLEERDEHRAQLVLAEDVTADNYAGSVGSFDRDSIPEGWNAKDIGPKTCDRFSEILRNAESVFWNGPMGVFEESSFEEGTRRMVDTLADHDGRVVVGGGDSGAAVSKYAEVDEFYHVSTGGGAALELLEGKTLPGFDALDPK
jgi:3-phosphoglycerate kinase